MKARFLFFVVLCMSILSCTTSSSKTSNISILQGNTIILHKTGTYNIGNIAVGCSSSAIVFTIKNQGKLNLNLTGSPIVEILGTYANLFSIDYSKTQSTIAPQQSTTFEIKFMPINIGTKTATISIENNAKSKNPFTFEIAGTGANLPEIDLKQGSTEIANSLGSYDFGDVLAGSSSSAILFTIENPGQIDLNLPGSPKIQVSGTDSNSFTIDQTTVISPVASGNSTTFSIIFNPTGLGSKTANISIENNDSDENPYTFTITGKSTVNSGDAIGWIGGNINGWKTTDGKGGFNTYQDFGRPESIFIDSGGYIFIVDSSHDRVCKWDKDGNAIGWIGGGSNGWKTRNAVNESGYDYQSFDYPSGVYVDSEGYIYVSDTNNHRISKWSSNGNAIGCVGGGSNTWKTTSAPANGSSHYQSFDTPMGICIDNNGIIYVSDHGNKRICKWDSNGNAIGWIGGGSNGWKTTTGTIAGTDYKSFTNPVGICLDSTGNIYISEFGDNYTAGHRVCKWDSSGTAIGWIGDGSDGWKTSNTISQGNDYKSFYGANGVFVDSAGFIFVADHYNNRISKWDSSGYAIGWLGGGSNGWKTSDGTTHDINYQSFHYPTSVFVDSDGFIYVTEKLNCRISKWYD